MKKNFALPAGTLALFVLLAVIPLTRKVDWHGAESHSRKGTEIGEAGLWEMGALRHGFA